MKNRVLVFIAILLPIFVFSLLATAQTQTFWQNVNIEGNLDVAINATVNNLINGYTSTATSGSTTTLTASSTGLQYFTGSSNQTVKLPAVSTLSLGEQFTIVNNSSGTVTVQSSGTNTLQAMAANYSLTATVISTSGAGTSSWSWVYGPENGGTVSSVAMTVPSFLSISGSPITTSGTLAISYSGTALPILNGGTAATSANAAFNSLSPMTTLGDIIYENVTPAATRLAGNTTSTNEFLTQTGTGSASAAPAWNTIQTTDLASTTAATSIGTIDAQTAVANGLQIVSNALYAQSATASVPGMVNTTTQTFAGTKTFNGGVFSPAGQTIKVGTSEFAELTASSVSGQGTVVIAGSLGRQYSIFTDGSNYSTPGNGITISDNVGGNDATIEQGKFILYNTSNAIFVDFDQSSGLTLGINGSSGITGAINLDYGASSGAAVTVKNGGATSAYNFNLPTTAGSSGQCLASAGGGSSAMTWASCGATVTAPTVQTFTSTGSTVGYVFGVSATAAGVASGCVYTSNGHSFTVLTSVLTGATVIWMTGSSAPSASGTLTYSSGGGSACNGGTGTNLTMAALYGSVDNVAFANYTVPSSPAPLYIECLLVGGGGGGGGTGSSDGSVGASSYFGSTGGVSTAAGGGGGLHSTNAIAGVGGAGGLGSMTTSSNWLLLETPAGNAGGVGANGTTVFSVEPGGGSGCMGGGAIGSWDSAGTGTAGTANTGGGGSAGNMTATNYAAGSGGGAGCVHFMVKGQGGGTTIPYVIGTGGAGGVGSSETGGAGGTGYLRCMEKYQ